VAAAFASKSPSPLPEMYGKVMASLRECLTDTGRQSHSLFRSMVILIFLAGDVVSPAGRKGEHAVSFYLLTVSLIFDIVAAIAAGILGSLGDPDSLAFQKSSLFPCLKLFSDWLVSNPKVLSSQDDWDTLIRGFPDLTSFHAETRVFWGNMVALFNVACPTQQTGLDANDPLLEDFEVLGFQPLLPTQRVLVLAQGCPFSGLPISQSLSPANSPETRWEVQERCIDRFAKTVVNASLLFYSEVLGSYSLDKQDEEQAIRERRERGMRAMAQARLQDQISSLEQNLSHMQGTPSLDYDRGADIAKILILDTSIFLFHMTDIEAILAAEKNLLVVPIQVISSLDELKKGNQRVNNSARDAIRYLQTLLESNTPWFRAQKDDEFLMPAQLPEDLGGFTRLEANQIASCPLYFNEKYGKRRTVYLVDDPTVEALCQKFEVTCSTSEPWVPRKQYQTSPRRGGGNGGGGGGGTQKGRSGGNSRHRQSQGQGSQGKVS